MASPAPSRVSVSPRSRKRFRTWDSEYLAMTVRFIKRTSEMAREKAKMRQGGHHGGRYSRQLYLVPVNDERES